MKGPALNPLIMATESYRPHVLSAVRASTDCGRRRIRYTSTPDLFWYVTWVVHSGSISVDGQRLWAPTTLILPPGSKQQIETTGGSDYTWIDWGVTTAKRIPRSDVVGPDSSHSLRYQQRRAQPSPVEVWGCELPIVLPDTCDQVSQQFAHCASTHWYGDELGQARVEAALALWIIDVVSIIRETDKLPDWIRLLPVGRARNACMLARQQLAIMHSVQEWAAASGLGRHQLNRLMQEQCGASASRVLDRLRCDCALALLRTPTTIPFIAQRAGFRRSESFARWFSRQFGVSPNRYRQQLS